MPANPAHHATATTTSMIAGRHALPTLALAVTLALALGAMLLGCPPTDASTGGAADDPTVTPGSNTSSADTGSGDADGPSAPDPLADLEGGEPLPAGSHVVTFPPVSKQSMGFISIAETEAIQGGIDFSVFEGADVGTVTFDVADAAADSSGSGSLTVPVAAMRTQVEQRDEHLRGPSWLNAAVFPEITFAIDSLEQVRPTVWTTTGTWNMHGVEKPLSVNANVRYIGEFPESMRSYYPGRWVRLQAKFDINLHDFDVNNPTIGGPFVAETWAVEIVLIGSIGEE